MNMNFIFSYFVILFHFERFNCLNFRGNFCYEWGCKGRYHFRSFIDDLWIYQITWKLSKISCQQKCTQIYQKHSNNGQVSARIGFVPLSFSHLPIHTLYLRDLISRNNYFKFVRDSKYLLYISLPDRIGNEILKKNYDHRHSYAN